MRRTIVFTEIHSETTTFELVRTSLASARSIGFFSDARGITGECPGTAYVSLIFFFVYQSAGRPSQLELRTGGCDGYSGVVIVS